jgi:hypothetical protein
MIWLIAVCILASAASFGWFLCAMSNVKQLLEPEQTAFTITDTGDGVRISWSDAPLDFVIQTYKQAVDLDHKLRCALGINQ